MRKKTNKLSDILKYVLFVLLITGAVAAVSGNANMIASAASSTPEVTSYWGNVTLNNSLKSNAIITVQGSNGIEVATTTSNQNGLYQILVSWDDSNTPADEGVSSGETITFKVDGTNAQSVIVGAQGTNNRQNLNVVPPGDIVSRYAGTDGIVQKSEAVQAINDYFSGVITRQNAVDVVLAYFRGRA